MAPRSVTPLPVLVGAVIRLLTERPRTIEELAEALVAEGLRLGRHPVERLEDVFDEAEELHQTTTLADGERLFWAPAALDGAVFTHELSAAEVAHDLLLATPDLLPLGMLVPLSRPEVPMVDGSRVRAVMVGPDDDVLAERGVPAGLVDPDAWLLTPGWFAGAGLAAGDTVAVAVATDAVRIDRCDVDAFDELLARRTRTLLHDLAVATDAEGPHEIDALIATVRIDDPTSFSEPLPPLGDLLEASGFTVQGDYLCPPGVDVRAQRTAARVQRISTVHGIPESDAEVVVVLTDLVARTGELQDAMLAGGASVNPADLVEAAITAGDAAAGQPPTPRASSGGRTVRNALDRLAVPAVAQASATEILGVSMVNAPALELTAGLLEPMVSRQARPAVRWLRAKAQERAGRVLEAERSLDAAHSLDPQWPPVLEDLARFASDRGDAERAVALLRRAGVDADDEELQLLESYRPVDRSDLGRNDACWCGSGRRYKACHRGRERLDLPARAGWLYHKAWLHMTDGPGRRLLLHVAEIWAEGREELTLLDALHADLVNDLVLFEGGVFADFVAARGALLPDDERLLAEQWLLVERSVYEVEEVRRDRGFTARDIRTGDRHEVSERLATRQLSAGELVLVRLVPDGRATVVFGGIELIDLARRDALVALLDSEPDAVTMAEFVAAMHSPPTLLNADGSELVLCQARVRVPDPDAVAAWLDDRLARADAETVGATWHERVDHAGGTSIRASATLAGQELALVTMSEDRFDDLLDAVLEAWPDVEVLEEQRLTVDDFAGSHAEPIGDGRMLHPRDADPEVAAALAEHVRGYEQRWLDEPIPALGGVTPRAAAADPTRRGDLVRLLDSFPDDDGDPGRMSPARLRAELGLT